MRSRVTAVSSQRVQCGSNLHHMHISFRTGYCRLTCLWEGFCRFSALHLCKGDSEVFTFCDVTTPEVPYTSSWHMNTYFCHLLFRKLNSGFQKKPDIYNWCRVISTKLRAMVLNFVHSWVHWVHPRSPPVGISFQVPLSFCCQQSKPMFSGDQVETFWVKMLSFSGDVFI